MIAHKHESKIFFQYEPEDRKAVRGLTCLFVFLQILEPAVNKTEVKYACVKS